MKQKIIDIAVEVVEWVAGVVFVLVLIMAGLSIFGISLF